MKLSIVTTLYLSEGHIQEFVERSKSVAADLVADQFEIILVNDGSPDGSLDLALELAADDPHLMVIDLSRNFGHHKAIFTGLAHACGEHIFLIDSDLEEDPAWLLAFWENMSQQACDVVFGVQTQRKGGPWEQFSGWIFYKLFNLLSGLNLPANIVTARLMTRRYVDALLLHKEREIAIGPLMLITGYKQVTHPITKLSTSPSTYTFRHKFAVMVDSVTSFSNKPLVWIFNIGLMIFLLACYYTLYLVVMRLFFATPLVGWTSVMASVWMLGGLIISFLGIIGIYLSKIFLETKQRPSTIIRAIHGSPRADRTPDSAPAQDHPHA